MAGRFDATTVIDRPIAEVFGSWPTARRHEVQPAGARDRQDDDGPTGVATVYASTVKDAGVKTKREFELTEFEAPTRIRWRRSRRT